MRHLILALMLAASPALAHDHAQMLREQAEMAATKPLTGASVYQLGSRWTDQNGKAVDLQALRGKPVVAAMAYTGCKDICPMIVANMSAIERAAKAKGIGDVHFVFFSLDVKNDTPERLKAYADARGLDGKSWSLLHGDAKGVRDLAAALGVRYKPDGQGGFNHSAVISLLDPQGEISFQKLDASPEAEEFVAKIAALKR